MPMQVMQMVESCHPGSPMPSPEFGPPIQPIDQRCSRPNWQVSVWDSQQVRSATGLRFRIGLMRMTVLLIPQWYLKVLSLNSTHPLKAAAPSGLESDGAGRGLGELLPEIPVRIRRRVIHEPRLNHRAQ